MTYLEETVPEKESTEERCKELFSSFGVRIFLVVCLVFAFIPFIHFSLPVFMIGLIFLGDAVPRKYRSKGIQIIVLFSFYWILLLVISVVLISNPNWVRGDRNLVFLIYLTGVLIEGIFLFTSVLFTKWLNQIIYSCEGKTFLYYFKWLGIIRLTSVILLALGAFIGFLFIDLLDFSFSEFSKSIYFLSVQPLIDLSSLLSIGAIIYQIFAGYNLFSIIDRYYYESKKN